MIQIQHSIRAVHFQDYTVLSLWSVLICLHEDINVQQALRWSLITDMYVGEIAESDKGLILLL